jgi:hypothetical protein
MFMTADRSVFVATDDGHAPAQFPALRVRDQPAHIALLDGGYGRGFAQIAFSFRRL